METKKGEIIIYQASEIQPVPFWKQLDLKKLVVSKMELTERRSIVPKWNNGELFGNSE